MTEFISSEQKVIPADYAAFGNVFPEMPFSETPFLETPFPETPFPETLFSKRCF
jgi:hypothetical protein